MLQKIVNRTPASFAIYRSQFRAGQSWKRSAWLQYPYGFFIKYSAIVTEAMYEKNPNRALEPFTTPVHEQ
jgi:hypothetical protein